MMDTLNHREILAVLARYFDGLYRADASILRPDFHDDLNYVNATRGAYVAKGLESYMEDIDGRTPPDQLGDERNQRILQIQSVGDRIVFVVASASMMGRDYIDALTLIETEDGWKIVSKAFSFTKVGEAPCPM